MREIVLPPIQIGKITNKLPKGTPKWVWRCACEECEQLPIAATLHGPFPTRRAAMHDAERTFVLMICPPEGNA